MPPVSVALGDVDHPVAQVADRRVEAGRSCTRAMREAEVGGQVGQVALGDRAWTRIADGGQGLGRRPPRSPRSSCRGVRISSRMAALAARAPSSPAHRSRRRRRRGRTTARGPGRTARPGAPARRRRAGPRAAGTAGAAPGSAGRPACWARATSSSARRFGAAGASRSPGRQPSAAGQLVDGRQPRLAVSVLQLREVGRRAARLPRPSASRVSPACAGAGAGGGARTPADRVNRRSWHRKVFHFFA